MRGADLNIDYEQTRSTGRTVLGYTDDFNTLLNQINQDNNNLKSCWKGDDAASYTSRIEEQAQVMKKLEESMREIGDYLIQVADTYEQTMRSNIVTGE